jgi:hypothetical protein
MNDFEKVGRLEVALRTERDRLRKAGGPANVRGSRALDEYLQQADMDSKLRFANILLDAQDRAEDRSRLRAVEPK